jgi:hypothetical protein
VTTPHDSLDLMPTPESVQATPSTLATLARWRAGVEKFGERRPDAISVERRAVLLRVSRGLLASPWAQRLADLSWADTDLFGCNPTAPVERIDAYGLVWLLAGCKLAAVTADAATTIRPSGVRQTYERRRNHGQVPLWELG